MQENRYKTRRDNSIIKSFFMHTFEDEFKLFISKYNLDKRALGPWLQPYNETKHICDVMYQPRSMELKHMTKQEIDLMNEEQDKTLSRLVKEIKVQVNRLSGISPLARRNILGLKPKQVPGQRKTLLSEERIPGMTKDITQSLS